MKRVILSALAAGIFATAAAQEELTLRKCLEIGLENNYDIRIVRNEERISDNNATAANAGMVPTIDFEAGYSGALDNERTTPREGDAWSDNGIYDQTFNAGINLNWTIFDGFRIRTNYKKLKEMQEMGTVRTRITIEDFVASLTAEYYNYVQQTLRLQNFRYAVALSRERLRITEARVSVGNFSRLDLLQARVDFNADSSKYMSQQELVSASRIRINELLANKDVNEMLCIRDSVIEVNGELKWEELLAQTLDTNASLLLAGHDNVLAELDLKTVQARNYPYLNLTTGYGYTYNRFGERDDPVARNAGTERRGETRHHDLRRQPPPGAAQRPHRRGKCAAHARKARAVAACQPVELLAGLPQQPRGDPTGKGEPDRRQGELRDRHGTLPAGRPAGHRDARSAEEPARCRRAHPHGQIQYEGL